MKTIWRLALVAIVFLGWVATYYHHPAGYVCSIVAAVMIVMSYMAEIIAGVKE